MAKVVAPAVLVPVFVFVIFIIVLVCCLKHKYCQKDDEENPPFTVAGAQLNTDQDAYLAS